MHKNAIFAFIFIRMTKFKKGIYCEHEKHETSYDKFTISHHCAIFD